jgi:hypothetical protein
MSFPLRDSETLSLAAPSYALGAFSSRRSQGCPFPIRLRRGEGSGKQRHRKRRLAPLSDAITSGFAFVGISVAVWTRSPAAHD